MVLTQALNFVLMYIVTIFNAITNLSVGGFQSVLVLYILFFTKYWWTMLIYAWFIYTDRNVQNEGGRPSRRFRNSRFVRAGGSYFPISFKKVEDCHLNSEKNYLFIGVPHGWVCSGFYYGISTGFKDVFPDHDFYGTTLNGNFYIPFHRELTLAYGLINVSAEAITNVLKYPYGGKVVGIAPGGADEAFYCQPGVYKTNIKKRKGFVKLALKLGVPLVPVFSFGETDMFDQFKSEKLRSFQNWFKKIFGFAPLIPKGRGWIQPSWMPLRRPNNVVSKYQIMLVCKKS